MLEYFFLRNTQTLRVNNSRILRIKNTKFLGYCFYITTNVQGDFQICISVPLTQLFSGIKFLIFYSISIITKNKRTKKLFYVFSFHFRNRTNGRLGKRRSSHRKCSVKKLILDISQNSQENTCDRVSFLINLEFYLVKMIQP